MKTKKRWQALYDQLPKDRRDEVEDRITLALMNLPVTIHCTYERDGEEKHYTGPAYVVGREYGSHGGVYVQFMHDGQFRCLTISPKEITRAQVRAPLDAD